MKVGDSASVTRFQRVSWRALARDTRMTFRSIFSVAFPKWNGGRAYTTLFFAQLCACGWLPNNSSNLTQSVKVQYHRISPKWHPNKSRYFSVRHFGDFAAWTEPNTWYKVTNVQLYNWVQYYPATLFMRKDENPPPIDCEKNGYLQPANALHKTSLSKFNLLWFYF